MKIEGAIFDLDGTLLNSMYIWDSIGEDYLRSIGFTPRVNLNEVFKTMSLKQAAEFYISDYGVKKTAEQIMQEVNNMIEDLYTKKVMAKIGVYEFLKKLKHQNIKMCVATASDKYLVEAALERNNLLQFFEKIFTCTDVGFGKDSPEIYNAALKFLKTHKENTIVFEDALYAIKTAKEAYFPVVGVYDKFEEKNQEKIKKLADKYIYSFDEMGCCID